MKTKRFYMLSFTDHNQKKIVLTGLTRARATELINRAILDCGYTDARVTPDTTTFSRQGYGKPLTN